MNSEHYNIGHTLVTPLPDGRVSYTPCRHCGEECEGHSVNTSPDARITAYVAELPAGRTPAEYADALARPSIHDLARRSAMAAAAKRNAEICAAAQPHCRTCGEECPRAQCDACRADGEASECEEERAAVVAWLRREAAHVAASRHFSRERVEMEFEGRYISIDDICPVVREIADAIERGEHRR